MLSVRSLFSSVEIFSVFAWPSDAEDEEGKELCCCSGVGVTIERVKVGVAVCVRRGVAARVTGRICVIGSTESPLTALWCSTAQDNVIFTLDIFTLAYTSSQLIPCFRLLLGRALKILFLNVVRNLSKSCALSSVGGIKS